MVQRIPHVLKVLSEATRLRILGLLAREELSVGEIARCLAMSQSRVSNHLKLLREQGTLDERKEGTSVLLRLQVGDGLPEELWAAIEPRLGEVPEWADDLDRLRTVLDDRRRRSREFFDRVASEWDALGSDFASGAARWQAVSSLVPRELVVADVGCGTGYVARALLGRVDRVILVDHSDAMLDQARQTLEGVGPRAEFRRGELDHLPLSDGEVDAVFAHMVLHHVPDLSAALREMARVLKPGGTLVVCDLLPHREHWMAEEMADLRLGIDPTDLIRRARAAEFDSVHRDDPSDAYVVQAPDGRRVEFPLFLLRARRSGVPVRDERNGTVAGAAPLREGNPA